MAKRNFTLKDYDKNEAKNYHAENALELVKKYGTKQRLKKLKLSTKDTWREGIWYMMTWWNEMKLLMNQIIIRT